MSYSLAPSPTNVPVSVNAIYEGVANSLRSFGIIINFYPSNKHTLQLEKPKSIPIA